MPSRAAVTASAGNRPARRSSRSSTHASAAAVRGRRQPATSAAARRSASAAGGSRTSKRHQLATAAAALALEPRASLRVALDRVGRQLLDVGEDRLRKQAEHLRLDSRARGGRGEAAPGHPCAHAIGGLEGVERAALAQLASAERRVDLATRGRGPPTGCGSVRRTAAAPRIRRSARPARTTPPAAAHSPAPRARSWRGSRRWSSRARARSDRQPRPAGRARARSCVVLVI